MTQENNAKTPLVPRELCTTREARLRRMLRNVCLVPCDGGCYQLDAADDEVRCTVGPRPREVSYGLLVPGSVYPGKARR
jgi:hypothetical protein